MCKFKYFLVVVSLLLFAISVNADTYCEDVLIDGKKHYEKGNYKDAQDCFEWVKKTCGSDYENVRYWIEKCKKALNPVPVSISVSEPKPFMSVSKSSISCGSEDTIVNVVVNSNIAWDIDVFNDTMYHITRQDSILKVQVFANMSLFDREDFFTIRSVDGKLTKKIVLKQIGKKFITRLSVDKSLVSCSSNDTTIRIFVSSNVDWIVEKPVGYMYSVLRDDSTLVIRVSENTTTSSRNDFFHLRTLDGEKSICINLCQKSKSLIFNVGNIEFKMVYVKGGVFVFDDFVSEKNNPENTYILNDYYIGEMEVTQSLWKAVMGQTIQEQRDREDRDSRLYGVGDDYPMYYISWSDAKKMCEKLNVLLKEHLPKGYRFSLPNEAQWKFAAKGGNNSLGYRYAGSNIIDSVAWFCDNSNLLHQVGTKQCNELGLFDMSGNVAECVQKNFFRYRYTSNTGWFCYCGGNWENTAEFCAPLMVSYQTNYPPYGVGLRLVLSKEKDECGLTFNVNGVDFNMVYVEGGEFEGKNAHLLDGVNVLSKFNVKLDDYYIGETEVTQALWNAVMGQTIQKQRDKEDKDFRLYGVGEDYPMYYISWSEANDMCEKLNELLSEYLPKGYKFMLPSASEWEFAARGGNILRTFQYAGNNSVDKVAWFNDNSSLLTHLVREKRANDLGLYDMSGNVAEWTSNFVCGGSWSCKSEDCKISNYKYYDEGKRYNCVGMRLLLKDEKQKERVMNFSVNDVDFKMIFVEGGEFLMGDNQDEFKNNLSHNVILDSYYMGETEVTQALWRALMGDYKIDNNLGKFKGDKYPIFNVSWFDANLMCEKLNEVLSVYLPKGYKFSLPTEAQWEFAARGGIHSHNCKYSGSNNLGIVAWFNGNSNEEKQFVALKYPNELGLYDMSGNVWEWCSDWYDRDYYVNSLRRNPLGPDMGDVRVLRGGSSIDDLVKCRVFYRNYTSPNVCRKFNGFRLSLSYRKDMFIQNKSVKNEKQPLLFNIKGVQFKMVYIAGGMFSMGATRGDKDMYENEVPQHNVMLDSYYMGEVEVTQALWYAVMDVNPSSFQGESRPVENVSWDDCQVFIKKLNELSGYKFSLPTEAQWEFAARNNGDYKYSGSDKVESVAFFDLAETKDVAQKKPNGFGLYDMSGNVWEWCSDWYAIYTDLDEENPTGPNSGESHVLRGGAWNDNARSCRVFRRKPGLSSYKDNSIGLRLVLVDYKD